MKLHGFIMQKTLILISITMKTSCPISILITNIQVVSFNFTKDFTNYISNKNFNPNYLNMMFRGMVVTGLWAHRGITEIMRASSNLTADIFTQEATYIVQVKYIQQQ